ncbi:MAG: sigma-70 family RNA polymerase sigma factor [Asticcacaulis sp.]|uniref:sigma-70 family RNA polymerase sigma factor n=1 Tax=Asticcacaulis sp. TaxID=1872648 RepID=UPI0039E5F67A
MRVDADSWSHIGDQSAELTLESNIPQPATPGSPVSPPHSIPDGKSRPEPLTDTFREAVIALIPALRAHAATRAGSRNEADDLVQETLTRAWRYRHSFREGSNLQAWLRKIMQNCLYQSLARQRDTVEDVEGRWAAQQAVAPSQEWHIHYADMLSALDRLPPDARAALVLIGASGWSYEEAALLANCPVGTLKSRVNRAREKLASLIGNTDLPADRRTPSRSAAPPAPFREQARQPSLQKTYLLKPSLQSTEE